MEYSGNKSFQNLIATIYNSKTGSSLTNADTGLLALSFLYSGVYGYDSGALNYRGTRGYYWSLRGDSDTYANYLNFYSTHVYPQDGYYRGRGIAVRCLAR